jgi:hypothetical protein
LSGLAQVSTHLAGGPPDAGLKAAPNLPKQAAMNGFFHWLLSGFGGLVFSAIVVAWWEHLGRQAKQSQAKAEYKSARVVSVDIELDALAASAQGTGDVYERQQALGGAIARMAGAAGAGWTDTAPMIGLGLRENDQAPKAPKAPKVAKAVKDKLTEPVAL